MMRRFLQVSGLFALICTLAGTLAFAQQPPGKNPTHWHKGLGLLVSIPVRDALKLTDAQMAKIKEIEDGFDEKVFRPFNQLPLDEQRQRTGEVRKLAQEMIDRTKTVLTAEQAARFRQIEIWTTGLFAFIDAEVARELDLTEQQKGALKTISDEFTNELAAFRTPLLQGGRGKRVTKEDFEQRGKQLAEFRMKLHAAKEAECLAVLTDDQKAAFEKLRGAKVETWWTGGFLAPPLSRS